MANVDGKRTSWYRKRSRMARVAKANQMRRSKRSSDAYAAIDLSDDIGNFPKAIKIEEYASAWHAMQSSQDGMPALESYDTTGVSNPPVRERTNLPDSTPSPTKILVSMVSDLASQLDSCRHELAAKTEQLLDAEAKLIVHEDTISRLQFKIDELEKGSIGKEN